MARIKAKVKASSTNAINSESIVQQLCTLEDTRPTCRAGPTGPASLKITLAPGSQLESEHLEMWRELQDSNPDLASPCFAPEFTQAVAAVREDVEVALVHQHGELAAIFPFQRRRGSRGGP